MNEKEFNTLKELLSTPKRIVITTHKGPDGDAMGSSLALYNYLVKKGHQVRYNSKSIPVTEVDESR